MVLLPGFSNVHRGILLLSGRTSNYPTLHIRSRRQQKPEDEKKVKDTRAHNDGFNDDGCFFLFLVFIMGPIGLLGPL